jgi:hypothetical protein
MKVRSPKARPRHRILAVEPLESRVVLDGNVRAFFSGDNLRIVGDSRDNEIVIQQSRMHSFRISSRDGSTTINGRSGPQTFTSIGGDLNISMERGSDVVEIIGTSRDAVTVSDRLIINTGAGNDRILMTEVHAIGLHINTGNENDTINVGESGAAGGLEITKEAIIITGVGQDNASISNSLFKRFLNLQMGNNNDQTTIANTSVRKRSTVHGGPGFDTLNREDNEGQIKYYSFERVRNFVEEPTPVAPVAVNDTATVARGSSVTINVAANDTSDAARSTQPRSPSRNSRRPARSP